MNPFVKLILISSVIWGPIVFLRIWSKFQHSAWSSDAKPSMDATVIDINSKTVWCGGKTKYKTKVCFSDGFIYTSYESYWESGLTTYKISIDSDLSNYIVRSAEAAHEKAVQKKPK